MQGAPSSGGFDLLPSHEEGEALEDQHAAERDWIRLRTLLRLLRTCHANLPRSPRNILAREPLRDTRRVVLFPTRARRASTVYHLRRVERVGDIETWYTAAELTELMLGRQSSCPMRNVSLDYNLEYRFVRMVLDVVESRAEDFDGR